MAAAEFCGRWFSVAGDTKLVAVDRRENREPFVFDCSAAARKPKDAKTDDGDGAASEETGSDRILAFAVSPSGKLAALTDDYKRLMLFQCEPSWRCISTRWVARRCTSMAFSVPEDELLAADKSGDVYSFSVTEPEKQGELKMGHLSMVLAVATSPDNRFIITADRDEKIRVSHLRSPYNIQSFCLGHEQFVSALLIPSGHPRLLLSGSGDGTLKLWDFTSGRRLQSLDLQQLREGGDSEEEEKKVTGGQEAENNSEQMLAVCRICSSPDGRHIAVHCEGLSAIQLFTLDDRREETLAPHGRLTLPLCPLDVTFDPEGRLWVLADSAEEPLRVYRLLESSWQREVDCPELSRVAAALKPRWDTLRASGRAGGRFQHLHKSSFDNVTVYLQRKQQRLEEQRQKRRKVDDGEKAETQ